MHEISKSTGGVKLYVQRPKCLYFEGFTWNIYELQERAATYACHLYVKKILLFIYIYMVGVKAALKFGLIKIKLFKWGDT